MARIVHCALLKHDAPGLDRPPYPGPLGQRIFEQVSKEGWERWRSHQIMLINEYRLVPVGAQGTQVPRGGNGEVPLRWRLEQAGGIYRSRPFLGF